MPPPFHYPPTIPPNNSNLIDPSPSIADFPLPGNFPTAIPYFQTSLNIDQQTSKLDQSTATAISLYPYDHSIAANYCPATLYATQQFFASNNSNPYNIGNSQHFH